VQKNNRADYQQLATEYKRQYALSGLVNERTPMNIEFSFINIAPRDRTVAEVRGQI
jgi:hypothetical protein